jgi:hypothetical protein
MDKHTKAEFLGMLNLCETSAEACLEKTKTLRKEVENYLNKEKNLLINYYYPDSYKLVDKLHNVYVYLCDAKDTIQVNVFACSSIPLVKTYKENIEIYIQLLD